MYRTHYLSDGEKEHARVSACTAAHAMCQRTAPRGMHTVRARRVPFPPSAQRAPPLPNWNFRLFGNYDDVGFRMVRLFSFFLAFTIVARPESHALRSDFLFCPLLFRPFIFRIWEVSKIDRKLTIWS
mmetsp:Transcript_27675/g.51588  ORF Transcript_27675/g.51588 Transcript_27675/m.51588 type:complete len:127 (+) Transcript_27675:456-836(+)